MTGEPTRDIEPPTHRPTPRRPWELHLGYHLEELYSTHVEARTVLTRGLSEEQLSELRTVIGWAADRLRDLNVEPSWMELLEEALARLIGQEEFHGAPLAEWLAARPLMQRRLDGLLQVVRVAIGDRSRYYDYGVMLYRVQLCAAMVVMAPRIPESIADALPDLAPKYREELLRATAVLQTFITANDPGRPRDPEQHELDREFDAFATYLTAWRNGEAEPDEQFFQRLDDVTHSAGLFRIRGRHSLGVTWSREAEPLAPEDRWPLRTPHTDEERETLRSLHQAARELLIQGEVERSVHILRDLLHTCRYVLGPVHPTTLNVQVDFAAAHIAIDRPGAATVLLYDIAKTAMHYYGPLQETRYLIVGHAYTWLKDLNPELAEKLHDFPLRSILERDEANLPPSLHNVRRTIRSALNMDAEPSSEGNDDVP